MGNVCGLHFFKVSKISLALPQLGKKILTLNGYHLGYVEKIKFQLCFGVLLAVFLPQFYEHKHEREKFVEEMRYARITRFTSGMEFTFLIMPSSPRAGIQGHRLQNAYTCDFLQHRDIPPPPFFWPMLRSYSMNGISCLM